MSPHPDAEHGLRVQLATALRELDEAKANTHGWLSVVEQLRDNLNATLLERDAIRADVKRLREALRGLLESAGFDWDGGTEVDAAVEGAVTEARAALAAPAAGEEK